MRRATPVELAPAERAELERWARGSGRLGVRARIVLEAAGGRTNGQIALQVGVHPETVTRWRQRFAVNRVGGLRRDAPRSGRHAGPSPSLEERIVRLASAEPPTDQSSWTTRTLARRLEVNHMRVYRTLKMHARRVETDDRSGSVRVDVAGVFLHSPAAAIVFAIRPTPADRSTDDTDPPPPTPVSGGYLFSDRHAAPNALVSVLSRAEQLISPVADTHRSPHALLVFLRELEENYPRTCRLHVFFDRPLDFVSERVTAWLYAHPRLEVVATPADHVWTDEIEHWLHGWDAVPLHIRSFTNFAPLIEAVARAVGGEGSGPFGFAWTAAPALPPTPLTAREPPRGRPSRTARPAPPLGRVNPTVPEPPRIPL